MEFAVKEPQLVCLNASANPYRYMVGNMRHFSLPHPQPLSASGEGWRAAARRGEVNFFHQSL